MLRQIYGEEHLADKKIDEVLKIAKAEHVELEQYRSIGTVEECREVMERQIPKKLIDREELFENRSPIHHYIVIGKCPTCRNQLYRGLSMSKGCPYCLQAIDWYGADTLRG